MSCIVDGCPKKACVQCADCKLATYCGVECAQQDWGEYHAAEHHMELCNPVTERDAMSYDSELSSEEANEDDALPSLGDLFETPLELVEARRGAGGARTIRQRKTTRTMRRPRRRRTTTKRKPKKIDTPFTSKASALGMSPMQLHRTVMTSPSEHTPFTRLQAALYGVLTGK